jgi:hypothetical protein
MFRPFYSNHVPGQHCFDNLRISPCVVLDKCVAACLIYDAASGHNANSFLHWRADFTLLRVENLINSVRKLSSLAIIRY